MSMKKVPFNISRTIFYTVLIIIKAVGIKTLGHMVKVSYWNRCLPQDDEYTVLNNVTFSGCRTECISIPECGAVNYHRIKALCKLIQNETVMTVTPSVCAGYILITRLDLQMNTSIDLKSSKQACSQTDLDSFGSCVVLGNMVAVGNKVRLQCPIYAFSCAETIFICGQNGQWAFERCMEELIFFTLERSYPSSGYTNLARGATVQMSSQFSGVSPGSLLTDGDRKANWPCACTKRSTNPYMVVDLGQIYPITHMFIVNRGDCCQNRLHDVRILLGTSLYFLKEYVHIPGEFGSYGTIKLATGVSTRYVNITILSDNQFLTICEFEVWNDSTL